MEYITDFDGTKFLIKFKKNDNLTPTNIKIFSDIILLNTEYHL